MTFAPLWPPLRPHHASNEPEHLLGVRLLYQRSCVAVRTAPASIPIELSSPTSTKNIKNPEGPSPLRGLFIPFRRKTARFATTAKYVQNQRPAHPPTAQTPPDGSSLPRERPNPPAPAALPLTAQGRLKIARQFAQNPSKSGKFNATFLFLRQFLGICVFCHLTSGRSAGIIVNDR